jgi:anhydro-N-acetylmuramic acid kinase
MSTQKVYRTIGLMSGTSLDGVDIALIETDGYDYVKPLDFKSYPYDDALQSHVKSFFGREQSDQRAIDLITDAHIAAVRDFGHKADIIGFHGQTIYHAPDEGITVQIGDGKRLSKETGMDVVYDLRSADVAAGGQGAPLLPLYHKALVQSKGLDLPVVILNIGGVSNVTYIASNGILAFDCGPGNALIDDFIQNRTGDQYDENGALGASGMPDNRIVSAAMCLDFFAKRPPKSLDRDAWESVAITVRDLSIANGAATLTAFTAEAIAAATAFFPAPAKSWYVGGGGRYNKTLMHGISQRLGVPVLPIDDLGWNGDALEAEGFAYLAVRSLLGEPLTLPETTGVPRPMSGGRIVKYLT